MIKLRDYQEQILEELKNAPAIGLFMRTGTGKSYTSLSRTCDNPTDKLLIICPKKIVSQWEDVLSTFDNTLRVLELPDNLSAKKKKEKIHSTPLEDYDVIVTNLEILYKLDLEEIVDVNWTVIVDESHKIKEVGTRRSPVKVTRSALALGEKTFYKIILTATPTQKDHGGYIDYYSQLKFLGAIEMSLREFKDRYCIERELSLPGRPYPIKTIVGYKNVQELDDILYSVARRYDAVYGAFEPQFTKIRIPRTPSYARTSRERIYEDILLDNVSRKRVALKTLTGGTISGHNEFGEKFTYRDNTNKIDWLKEFLTDTDETVSVFYQYNVELELLEELAQSIGKKYVMINGNTKDKYRELRKEFDVVFIQYQAGAESLDGLQEKTHLMVLYSLPESALLHTQALGRIDRIGQEQVPMYYYLVMEKTIDEAIYEMIQNKVEYNEEVLNKLLLEELK